MLPPATDTNGDGLPPDWRWPDWATLATDEPQIEVLVIDPNTNSAQWLDGTPVERVLTPEGRNAYLLVAYSVGGGSWKEDFEPSHVRRKGDHRTVADELMVAAFNGDRHDSAPLSARAEISARLAEREAERLKLLAMVAERDAVLAEVFAEKAKLMAEKQVLIEQVSSLRSQMQPPAGSDKFAEVFKENAKLMSENQVLKQQLSSLRSGKGKNPPVSPYQLHKGNTSDPGFLMPQTLCPVRNADTAEESGSRPMQGNPAFNSAPYARNSIGTRNEHERNQLSSW